MKSTMVYAHCGISCSYKRKNEGVFYILIWKVLWHFLVRKGRSRYCI